MQNRIFIFLVFLLLFPVFNSHTQPFYEEFTNRDSFNKKDSNSLFFQVSNVNFLKNNEFFNEYVDGYTLLGYHFNSGLRYYAGSKTRIDAGIFLLKYSGLDKFTKILPVFTFQYKPGDRFKLLVGNLNGTLHHRLPEPMFQTDRFYTNPVENGLQLLFDYPVWEADIWCSWEYFIFPMDINQERIFGGFSGKIKLPEKSDKWKLEFPFSTYAIHRGGQIDTSKADMATITNSSAGIHTSFKLKKDKQTGLRIDYILNNDLSPVSHLAFISGYGLYSRWYYKTPKFIYNLGYWFGDHYESPRGEPLFFCVSDKDFTYYNLQRSVVFGGFKYHKEIAAQIDLSTGVDFYYDIPAKQFDYSFELNIFFNREFLLWKEK